MKRHDQNLLSQFCINNLMFRELFDKQGNKKEMLIIVSKLCLSELESLLIDDF